MNVQNTGIAMSFKLAFVRTSLGYCRKVHGDSNLQDHFLFFFYRITSAKAAATDPLWNPSIAGRELLKPKFYDVWLDVSGKNQVIATKTKSPNLKGEGVLKGEPSRDKDAQPMKQRVTDSNSAMKEMQRLMLVQLQVRTMCCCFLLSVSSSSCLHIELTKILDPGIGEKGGGDEVSGGADDGAFDTAHRAC